MDPEKKKDFVARISQANRSQLTVVVFDIIIEETACALNIGEKYKGSRTGEQGRRMSPEDLKNYEDSLKMARKFIGELIDTLDLRYDIARQLRPLYVFFNKEIIYAFFSGNTEKLSIVIGLLKQLRDSFETISHQDFSEPLMENTQKIYAGLTYGRGQLNEISVDVSQGQRGFKV